MKKKHLSLLMATALAGGPLAAIAAVTPAEAGEAVVEFDMEILRQRGVDPAVASYFSRRARFAPGRKTVDVSLNGRRVGSITVRFNNHGEPCVDRALLDALRLKVPTANAEDTAACFDYASAFPGTLFTLLPTEDRIEMVTPPEALLPLSGTPGNYSAGGTAALLNYSLFTSRSQMNGAQYDYRQGMFESGLNIHDWLVRSKQMVSQSDGVLTQERLYTYAQHTFTGIKKTAQLGQINIGSTLFSGSAINGVQLVPENALDNDAGSGVTVSGLAQMPQARVDIRQSGALIFSTLVPAGPFTLKDIPVISANTDLHVSVTETSGAVNRFIVQAASLSGMRLGRPQGLSMALGTLRDVQTPFDKPWLATFSNGWQVTERLNLAGGLMTARHYQSLAGGVELSPVKDLLLSARLLSARDQLNGNQGQQLTASASYQTPFRLSFSLSGTQNSRGYRDLQDIFDEGGAPHTKHDYGFSVGWSHARTGSVSLGYSRSVAFDASNDATRLTASWNKSFYRASVSISWQHDLDSESTSESWGVTQSGGDTLYLNLSIPFGAQSLNLSANDDGTRTRYGAQTAGSITPNVGYSLSADTADTSSDRSLNGSLTANLHYARLGLNAGTSGQHSRNRSATLDGGMVVHAGGLTFSPYVVQETFALATLDKPMAGVEISTPQGTVWTDRWGNAVVPSLAAYQSSSVMVNTESLPKNVDINNGMKTVSAGHGSVSQLQFGVLAVRRVMLTLTMPDGKPVQKGTAIFDAAGQYVTTAVEDGVVFLADAENAGELYALTDDAGHKCRLTFALSAAPDLNAFYEHATATCVAGGAL